MNAFIKSSFWQCPEFEDVSPEVRLAAIWIISNPNRDAAGFTKASGKKFQWETGLDPSVLEEALLLPQFERMDDGLIWAVGFIQHQIGIGKSALKNNQSKGAIKAVQSLGRTSRERFFEEYPEFINHVEENDHPKPLEGLGKPLVSPSDSSNHAGSSVCSGSLGDQILEANSKPSEGLGKPLEAQGREGIGEDRCGTVREGAEDVLPKIVSGGLYSGLPENIATLAEKIDSLSESWARSPKEWVENNALQQSIFGRLGSLEDMQPDDWRTLRWFYLQAERNPDIKVTHRRLSLVDDINAHIARARSAWAAAGKPSLAKIKKAAA